MAAPNKKVPHPALEGKVAPMPPDSPYDTLSHTLQLVTHPPYPHIDTSLLLFFLSATPSTLF